MTANPRAQAISTPSERLAGFAALLRDHGLTVGIAARVRNRFSGPYAVVQPGNDCFAVFDADRLGHAVTHCLCVCICRIDVISVLQWVS
jgi:hypothetical protein